MSMPAPARGHDSRSLAAAPARDGHGRRGAACKRKASGSAFASPRPGPGPLGAPLDDVDHGGLSLTGVDRPAWVRRSAAPGPGHPLGDRQPLGGDRPRPEHDDRPRAQAPLEEGQGGAEVGGVDRGADQAVGSPLHELDDRRRAGCSSHRLCTKSWSWVTTVRRRAAAHSMIAASGAPLSPTSLTWITSWPGSARARAGDTFSSSSSRLTRGRPPRRRGSGWAARRRWPPCRSPPRPGRG